MEDARNWYKNSIVMSVKIVFIFSATFNLKQKKIMTGDDIYILNIFKYDIIIFKIRLSIYLWFSLLNYFKQLFIMSWDNIKKSMIVVYINNFLLCIMSDLLCIICRLIVPNALSCMMRVWRFLVILHKLCHYSHYLLIVINLSFDFFNEYHI